MKNENIVTILLGIASLLSVLLKIAIIILGMYLAGYFGLTGLVWWSFVFVFFIVFNQIMLRIKSEGDFREEMMNELEKMDRIKKDE